MIDLYYDKANKLWKDEKISVGYQTRKELIDVLKKMNKNSSKYNGQPKRDERFYSAKLHMQFRSSWEVTIAELLSDLDVKFDYEPKRFYFRREKESYLPDFFLPEYNLFIEVKGYMDKRSERRCRLFKKYYTGVYQFFILEKLEYELILKNPELLMMFIENYKK